MSPLGWRTAAAGLWERRRRMMVAVAMVPLLLVLAVVGAGWNTTLESPERAPSDAGSVGLDSTPDLDLRPFMILALFTLLALLVLIARDRAWTGFLIVGLLAVGLVALGLLGGRLERGAQAPAPEPLGESGDAREAEAARNPRLIIAWALIGTSAVAAMLVAVRHNRGEPEGEEELSEAVADIAATLDAAVLSPRHNIITMYASLEAALARGRNARGPSETTAEFSARVLRQLGVDAEPCAELAEMYQHVGFGEREALPGDQLRAAKLLRSISVDLAVTDSDPAPTDA